MTLSNMSLSLHKPIGSELTLQKYKKVWKRTKKNEKDWKISGKCLSLQRQLGEFAERMTTFMAFGSFRAPTIRAITLRSDGFVYFCC
jgi:hypothetical protein